MKRDVVNYSVGIHSKHTSMLYNLKLSAATTAASRVSVLLLLTFLLCVLTTDITCNISVDVNGMFAAAFFVTIIGSSGVVIIKRYTSAVYSTGREIGPLPRHVQDPQKKLAVA
jgi:hypothetical protein